MASEKNNTVQQCSVYEHIVEEMIEGRQRKKGKCVFFLAADRSIRKCTFLKAEVLKQLSRRAIKRVHCLSSIQMKKIEV